MRFTKQLQASCAHVQVYNISYTWLSIHLLDTLTLVSLSKNLWGKSCSALVESYRRFCKVFKENIPNIFGNIFLTRGKGGKIFLCQRLIVFIMS